MGMKATVEISDALLMKAKKLAKRRKTTLRAVIEEGLTLVLTEKGSFKLRDCSVKGDGMTDEFQGVDWSKIRKAAYGDRE